MGKRSTEVEPHEFRDVGQSRVYGRRIYAICGLFGCGKPKHAPAHRGQIPRVVGLQAKDRHPFVAGEGERRLQCQTCGKVRNSQRHRTKSGVPFNLPAPRHPVPVVAEPPARPEPHLGQDPLLYLALGYCEALQVVQSVPVTVRFNARQLARSIRDALQIDNIPAPGVVKSNGHSNGNGHAEPVPAHPSVTIQSGTPAVRRAFRSGLVRGLFDVAVRAGWTWRRSGNGHVIIDAPGQRTHISLSTTMSDAGAGRSWGNLKAEAKRKGLAIE